MVHAQGACACGDVYALCIMCSSYVCREGDLDERLVELELPASPSARMMGPWNAGDASTMQEMVVRVDKLFGAGRGRGEKRKMKVRVWGLADDNSDGGVAGRLGVRTGGYIMRRWVG